MDRNEKEIEHYGSCHCQKVQYKIITPKEGEKILECVRIDPENEEE